MRRAAPVACSVALVAASILWAIILFLPQILTPGSDFAPCLSSWSTADVGQKGIGALGIALAALSLFFARRERLGRWLLAVVATGTTFGIWWLIAAC